MATEKQFEANRQNAQKSTGPKTPEGRAAVRLNGVKHGLTAETMVVGHRTPPHTTETAFTGRLLTISPQCPKRSGRNADEYTKQPRLSKGGKIEIDPLPKNGGSTTAVFWVPGIEPAQL